MLGIICYGYLLISACPAGTWGPSCENKCPCMNGASCDPMSGACTCPPGWIGDKCQTTCDPSRLVSMYFKIIAFPHLELVHPFVRELWFSAFYRRCLS